MLDSIDVSEVAVPKVRTIDVDQKSKRKEGQRKVQATAELSRGGYLKGDTISAVIQISHTKPIKNMRGIIVTLYRLGRFDAPE